MPLCVFLFSLNKQQMTPDILNANLVVIYKELLNTFHALNWPYRARLTSLHVTFKNKSSIKQYSLTGTTVLFYWILKRLWFGHRHKASDIYFNKTSNSCGVSYDNKNWPVLYFWAWTTQKFSGSKIAHNNLLCHCCIISSYSKKKKKKPYWLLCNLKRSLIVWIFFLFFLWIFFNPIYPSIIIILLYC